MPRLALASMTLASMTLAPLTWCSQRIGTSITAAAAAWMVSGMSASPLLNSLLPALGAATALLPIPSRARAGVALQLAGVLLLLHVATGARSFWLGWPLIAVALVGLGTTSTLVPLQRWLLAPQRLDLTGLRLVGDAGAVLGSLLTAALVPIRPNMTPQFTMAALMLLPTALLVWGPSWRAPRPLAEAEPEPAAPEKVQQGSTGGRLDLYPRGCLQGLLFGALFALLPLWVRTISQGTCVDFGMVLTIYGVGRPLAPLFRLAAALRYLAMALLLLSTFWLSGWLAILLFLPLGGLAAGSDAALADRLTHAAQGADRDGAERLNSVERSFALGGVLGSVVMGAACQALGLASARWLMVAGFLIAAFALPMRPAPATDPDSPGQGP